MRDGAVCSDSNYRSLEEKQKKAADTLHDDNRITIRRDHIVTDLLSAYQDQDITTKHLLVTIENDEAYGSGVAREMYDCSGIHFYPNMLRERASSPFQFY